MTGFVPPDFIVWDFETWKAVGAVATPFAILIAAWCGTRTAKSTITSGRQITDKQISAANARVDKQIEEDRRAEAIRASYIHGIPAWKKFLKSSSYRRLKKVSDEAGASWGSSEIQDARRAMISLLPILRARESGVFSKELIDAEAEGTMLQLIMDATILFTNPAEIVERPEVFRTKYAAHVQFLEERLPIQWEDLLHPDWTRPK